MWTRKERAFRTHFTVVLFQETSLYCYVLFIGKEPPEATFTGNEFLTYDLSKLGGEPILSTKDEISLYFRTNRDDGLLFYTGKIEIIIKFNCLYLSISMTSLLTYNFAHSTRHSFMPKNNNQPLKKLLNLAFSKVVKNWTSF